MAVAEAYPDLKANQEMMQLMEELTSTENKVAFARQAYNDSCMIYNTTRETFPTNLIANTFNFAAAELFVIEKPEWKRPRRKFRFSDVIRQKLQFRVSYRTWTFKCLVSVAPIGEDDWSARRKHEIALAITGSTSTLMRSSALHHWTGLYLQAHRGASSVYFGLSDHRHGPADLPNLAMLFAAKGGNPFNPCLFLAVARRHAHRHSSAAAFFKDFPTRQSGGSVVAEMLGGRPINANTSDPDERKLLNVVEEMAIASGTPIPQCSCVLPGESGINAFAAAGHSTKRHGCDLRHARLPEMPSHPRRAAGSDRPRIQPHSQWRHETQPPPDGHRLRHPLPRWAMGRRSRYPRQQQPRPQKPAPSSSASRCSPPSAAWGCFSASRSPCAVSRQRQGISRRRFLRSIHPQPSPASPARCKKVGGMRFAHQRSERRGRQRISSSPTACANRSPVCSPRIRRSKTASARSTRPGTEKLSRAPFSKFMIRRGQQRQPPTENPARARARAAA